MSYNPLLWWEVWLTFCEKIVKNHLRGKTKMAQYQPDPKYYEEVVVMEEPIKACLVAFLGKDGLKRFFWSRQVSPDAEQCDCMNCHFIIGYMLSDSYDEFGDPAMEIPLRLWPVDGKHGELTFCRDCATKLNIYQAMFGADPL